MSARAGGRLASLDAFRGATIAAMVVVNNPGDWGHVYAPLLHAAWHGLTPTDLIFPFFLSIAGAAGAIALAPAIDARERGEGVPGRVWAGVLRRAATLVLVGLLLNGFPRYELDTLRIPGVLQRIGLAWGVAAAVALAVPRRGWTACALALLAAYGLVLAFAPAPGGEAFDLDPERNVARWIDLQVLGAAHLWRGAATDPEGLLSTLGAVATVLLGFALGERVRTVPRDGRVERWLLAHGAASGAAGLVLAAVVPVNKSLWTPSYVLVAHGAALIAFWALWRAVEVHGARRFAFVLDVFGRNAILLFVGSGVVARVLNLVGVAPGTSLKAWIHAHAFAAWLPPHAASLAFALASLALWWLLLLPLHRRGLFWRV